jgi:hypothetical protein
MSASEKPLGTVGNVGTQWWCKPNTPKISIADYQRIKKIILTNSPLAWRVLYLLQ